MFGKQALETALQVALARIADQQDEIREGHSREEKLLDRIMALTNVGALREVHRPLPKASEAPPESTEEPKQMRSHRFPGNETLTLPTHRPEPPNAFPLPKKVS